MLRRRGWADTWSALRAAMAVLGAAAIIAQAVTSIGGAISNGRDVGTTVANFFSFFTILSNVLAVIVLVSLVAWYWLRGRRGASPEPRGIAIALASVTTYMIITGVVYNTLLRGIPLPQGTTVPWSNEVLHVVAPLFLLVDLFLAPRRRCLGWGAIAAVLVFPLVWVVYTMLRGPLVINPLTGDAYWYPYPFLDPNSATTGGYLGVTAYIVGIAIGIAVVAAGVIAVGRYRGHATDARTPSGPLRLSSAAPAAVRRPPRTPPP
jgi:hypothetical protein